MKWISVKDRLPKVGRYLCCSQFDFVLVLLRDHNFGWVNEEDKYRDDYWNQHITHWMPLPNPPKKRKKKQGEMKMSIAEKILLEYTASENFEQIKDTDWTTAEIIELFDAYFKRR
ncbi:MAG: DUF551 domain-containing protein [bacterium]|nr:DUF551 domain-containing protein [bacterium]